MGQGRRFGGVGLVLALLAGTFGASLLTAAPASAAPTEVRITYREPGVVGGIIHARAGFGDVADPPTGDVTFHLWEDTGCTLEVHQETRPLDDTGTAATADVEALAPGDFWWTADYLGDDDNDPSSSPCGASASNSNVSDPGTFPWVRLVQAPGQADPTDDQPVRFTATFSRPVVGFEPADVLVSGTAGGTKEVVVTPAAGNAYDIDITGMTTPGTVVVHIPEGAALSFLGSPSPTAISYDRTVTWDPDPDAPTVTVTRAAGQAATTGVSPVRFTATFSESVAGFATGDVLVQGTAGGPRSATVTPAGGTSYTVDVTGMTTDGTVVVKVPKGAATAVDDGTSNLGSATTLGNTVTWDTTAPTVTIEYEGADPIRSSRATFIVEFSEPLGDLSFVHGDVAFTSTGTIGARSTTFLGLGANRYRVSVGAFTSDGVVTASVPAGAVTDVAGNPNVASTSVDATVQIYVDFDRPRVEQAADQLDPEVHPGATLHYQALFQRPVTDFAAEDIVLAGTAGATTVVVTGSGTTYDLMVSGMTGPGTVEPRILADSVHDPVGGTNYPSQGSSIDPIVTYDPDDTPPSVEVRKSGAQDDETAEDSIEFVAGFSEDVTGFGPEDVVVGGTATGTWAITVTMVTANFYEITVRGMETPGTVQVSVPAGAAFDRVDLPNLAGPYLGDPVTWFVEDDVAPTVTVEQAVGQADPTTAAPIRFAVVFSEPVGGLAPNDVEVGGTGAAGTTVAIVPAGDDATFTIEISGMTTTGLVTASIPAGAVVDLAGNPSEASTSEDGTVAFEMPPPDSDGDGVIDDDDNCVVDQNPEQADLDGDDTGDVCDPDDDDDGVTDDVDAFPADPDEALDTDGDRVGDNADNCVTDPNPDQADADGDEIGDLCDGPGDADGDGVPDDVDAFPSDPAESVDTDEDGVGDNADNCLTTDNLDQADLDHDGLGDACDPDDDDDGVNDDVDAFPADPGESVDADGDGVGNNRDNCVGTSNADQADVDGDEVGDACDGPADSDGDGVSDDDDAFPNDPAESVDTDGDTVGDNADNCVATPNADQADADGDDVGDLCEGPVDTDGDGVPDQDDAFPSDPDESVDTDGDGVGDHADSCVATANPGQADLDHDGLGDACDPDDDEDGVADGEDAFPTDPAESADSDGDLVGDHADNCVTTSNPDQADSDGDDTGDACEPAGPIDTDGDGVPDQDDAFPDDPDESVDTDGDGVGDHADSCVTTTNPDQADLDQDGLGNPCDPDDDGDGVPDAIDAFPTNPSEAMDTDRDGVGDNADNCVTTANANQADADGDGIGNACDRAGAVLRLDKRLSLSLQAVLTNPNGSPIKGARVVFTTRSGQTVCTAVTDAKGRAKCGFGIGLLVKLIGGYRATYAGDATRDPATVTSW